MEPKNSADNSAPSMPKQDEPQDTATSSQEVSVDFTDNQGSTSTADTPLQGSDFENSSTDNETSSGIGSTAAGGTVEEMPSLTSEAPTDQVAALPTDPAEGAPIPGDPGQPGSTDRIGAVPDAGPMPVGLGASPAPSDAPGPQPPLAPTTDEPAPTPNTVPPVAPVTIPGHHDNKMMFLLVGAGVLVLIIIALAFLI